MGGGLKTCDPAGKHAPHMSFRQRLLSTVLRQRQHYPRMPSLLLCLSQLPREESRRISLPVQAAWWEFPPTVNVEK